VIVKPLLGISTYVLDWLIDKAIIGGAAWILGAVAKFSGALLQRWQSGNIRSYAAWLAVGVAAVLLFAVVPWSAVLAHWFGIHLGAGGH
jgi:NADH-quinone oxidoreductase subunit L